MRAVTRPDAQPGERAGADADRDRGQVLPDDAGVGQHRLDQRGQLLAVPHPLLRASLGDDVRPVVEGDGHVRRGRVEREQHASEATERGSARQWVVTPPVVVDEVERQARWGVVPDRRRGPRRPRSRWRRRRRRSAADAPRTSWRSSCAHARRAWRRRAGGGRSPPPAHHRPSAGSGPSAPARWSWAGGAGRRTPARRTRRARASSQASWSSPSRPSSTRSPATASISESSITNRWSPASTTDRAGTPRPVDERGPDVVVAGADRDRAGPAVEPRPGCDVLVREPVVGDVAAEHQHVGARVHREQVLHDGGRAMGRVLHVVAEVRVTDVRHHEHGASLARRRVGE